MLQIHVISVLNKLFNFFSIAEFGVGSVISYRLYEQIAAKDIEKISKYMSMYKWAYRAVGVVICVLAGIGAADRQLLEMARVFRVPFRRQLWGIWLPAVLPYFRSAASLALGLCWKAGVAAEVIGLPAGSIGEALYTAKVYFQTGDLFAWTAAVILLSLLMERALTRLIRHPEGGSGL